ncbi:MAG TPA: hypothetical protein VHC22_21535 [Pirellulales bacterium]|nr:hypothetical protein [Pirellulales bacterium]
MEPKTIQNIDEPDRHDSESPKQVAPPHEVELADNFDRRQMVRDFVAQHPDASADDVVRAFHERRVDVSTTLVLQELERRRS